MEIAKKKIFYCFLVINALLWSFICLFRNVMGDDALEAISWGELIDFGTNKHPPLSGWLMGGVYHLFGEHDYAAYFLGALCVTVGFIFIYKLAKLLMDEEKALSASLVMVPCYYYTYTLFYENYNCNILSMAIWPMIAYYFYKSVKEDRISDWILFGVSFALGALTKYQIVFLFLALFIYILFFKRDCLKRKGLYISISVGLLAILPHIIWLFQHDFFSFAYMTDRTGVTLHNTPDFLLRFGRVVFPIKFILDQIFSVLPCVLLFVIAALQSKNISCKDPDRRKSDAAFVCILCFVPILLQSLMGAISNTRVMGMWGSIMVSFFGIFLFYMFPVKFNKNTFNFLFKCVCALSFVWMTAMFLFSQLHTKFHMGFPYQKILPEIVADWDSETNNAELKYIGGNGEYVYKIKQYCNRPVKVILETFGYKNPWISEQDILKYGSIIFGKSAEEVERWAKESVVLLPDNYQIKSKRYDYEITNKVGKSKQFHFYYTIIPPMYQ